MKLKPITSQQGSSEIAQVRLHILGPLPFIQKLNLDSFILSWLDGGWLGGPGLFETKSKLNPQMSLSLS